MAGFEHRTLMELRSGEFTPAGYKVLVQEVTVRHGILVLNPDNTKVIHFGEGQDQG